MSRRLSGSSKRLLSPWLSLMVAEEAGDRARSARVPLRSPPGSRFHQMVSEARSARAPAVFFLAKARQRDQHGRARLAFLAPPRRACGLRCHRKLVPMREACGPRRSSARSLSCCISERERKRLRWIYQRLRGDPKPSRLPYIDRERWKTIWGFCYRAF